MEIKDYIAKYDPTEQFEVLRDSYKQIEFAQSLNIKNNYSGKNFGAVIVTGMGGSAISADLMKNYLQNEIKVPLIVNRSYQLPEYAKNNLVIISSYSGNTEESVSVFRQALKNNCDIICITTGGEVKQIAEENGVPCYLLKPGMQPRYSLGQSFFTLLRVLASLKIIPNQDSEISAICELWNQKGKEYSSERNIAIKYAQELTGFVPVIYSAVDLTDAVGYRFKCQLNENSKVHAFHNAIPELNHNEIIGWESFAQKDFRAKLITIVDPSYPEQFKKRFKITSELITSKETEIINLESSQSSLKIRLFDLIYLTDWISYYLAVVRGFDPVEIDYINILKNRLI